MIDPAVLPTFQAILPYLRRGRGKCPLCDSRTGFSASEGKGVWHCFSCGEAGDKITLVQKIHGLTFKDALIHLGIGDGPLPTIQFQYQKNDPAAEWADKLGRMLRDEFHVRERMIFNARNRLREDSEDEVAWNILQAAFHNRDKLEWLLDMVDIGKPEEREEIYHELKGQQL